MVSEKRFNGDGATRIFPLEFKILGEQFIRVYVGGTLISDLTTYDIVNNSVVFTEDNIPVTGTENVQIYVATSVRDLGDLPNTQTNIDIVANNITAINSINDNMSDVNYFADRYLGDKATDPTTRNDGNALVVGDLYYNTTDLEMRVYNGTIFELAGSVISGLIDITPFVATQDQTVFTGLTYDANSASLVTRAGNILVPTVDYTANDGSTLTLTTGARAGDNILFFAFGAFNGSLSDLQAEIDTNTASITTINTNGAFKNQANVFTEAQRINSNLGLNTADYGSGTGVLGLLDASVLPTTNPTGGLILYSEGGVLKYRKPDGSVFDSSDKLQLATTQENFDISTTTAVSPSILFNDNRVRDYTIYNETGTVNTSLTPGSTYKINSGLLATNETRNGLTFQLKDKNNANQATYTVNNDKFLFPSNLYTHNHSYKTYMLRIISTFDRPLVGSNESTIIHINLRREVDDSLVASKDIVYHNVSANTADVKTREFTTFVGGETDPYVADGMYVEIENDSDSDTNITVVSANVRIWAI